MLSSNAARAASGSANLSDQPRARAASASTVGFLTRRARAMYLLTVDGEPFAAGGQHPDVRAGLDDPLGQIGGRIEEVLAVVEHEEQVLGPEELDDAPGQIHAGAARHRQGRRHDLNQRVGAVGGGQLAEPCPVGIVRQHLCCDLDGQPGLADASDAGQGHDRGRPQGVGDLVELLAARAESIGT